MSTQKAAFIPSFAKDLLKQTPVPEPKSLERRLIEEWALQLGVGLTYEKWEESVRAHVTTPRENEALLADIQRRVQNRIAQLERELKEERTITSSIDHLMYRYVPHLFGPGGLRGF